MENKANKIGGHFALGFLNPRAVNMPQSNYAWHLVWLVSGDTVQHGGSNISHTTYQAYLGSRMFKGRGLGSPIAVREAILRIRPGRVCAQEGRVEIW